MKFSWWSSSFRRQWPPVAASSALFPFFPDADTNGSAPPGRHRVHDVADVVDGVVLDDRSWRCYSSNLSAVLKGVARNPLVISIGDRNQKSCHEAKARWAYRPGSESWATVAVSSPGKRHWRNGHPSVGSSKGQQGQGLMCLTHTQSHDGSMVLV